MSESESTHLVFDGKKIIISPDITDIFLFLMEIEKEIESFLGFEKKLQNIRSDYTEILNFTQFLAKKLKDNNIDFEYTFAKHPSKLADELQLHLPVRSQMIVLFSNLEVLFCLSISYIEQTDKDDEIRDAARDTKKVKKFLNKYCLTDNNSWYKENKKKAQKISAKQLRDLRNSLVHFFSVSAGLSVIPPILNEKAKKLEDLLEKNGQSNSTFISPEDLYEVIKGASMLMIKEWNDEFDASPQEFKQKILCTQSVVKRHAPKIMQNKHLRIE